MQYKRISADCHLDMLWLPPDLFTSNASSKLRDKMPFVAKQPDGTEIWTDNAGANYGMPGSGPRARRTSRQAAARDKMAEAGSIATISKRACAGPATRICASRSLTATVSARYPSSPLHEDETPTADEMRI